MPMAFETEPFNGDHYIGERIRELVAKHGVKTIVETGTYQGVTTKALSQMCDHVVTIEKNERNHDTAFSNLVGHPNVMLLQGDSADVLLRLIPRLGEPILFYLDAHWGSDWPLLAELKAIRLAERPVIVIHDFEVPRTDLGFDEYNGVRLNWAYIEKAVDRIYGCYTLSANDPERAAGARRGVLYLEPR